jgi:hypothetical protein
MAVHFGPSVSVNVQQEDLNASWRLVQRMYQGQTSLPMVVFGTEQPPMPTFFQDPNHPLARQLVSMINDTYVFATTHATVGEWHLSPQEVDQLQMEDPRITTLRQRLANEIALLPQIQELRRGRAQMLNQVLN